MKKIDIVVIGAGLYVCGKGTKGFGTILPAIFESKRNNKNIGAIHCVSTSISSSIEFLDKAEKLRKKTGVDIEVSAHPRNDSEANFSSGSHKFIFSPDIKILRSVIFLFTYKLINRRMNFF